MEYADEVLRNRGPSPIDSVKSGGDTPLAEVSTTFLLKYAVSRTRVTVRHEGRLRTRTM